MIDWVDIVKNDGAVPDDIELGQACDELVEMLADPSPETRDELAYRILATWIASGVLPDLERLGDRMVEMFAHPAVHARSFAALVLAVVIERDDEIAVVPTVARERWCQAFLSWWTTERETTGWDPMRGWLHAVAHGADLMGAFGMSRATTPSTVRDLLVAAAARVTAPTVGRFEQQEEDRIAYAAARTLERSDLTFNDATDWLVQLTDMAADRSLPTTSCLLNTISTLRALYVFIERGSSPHRRAVLDLTAAALRQYFDAYPA